MPYMETKEYSKGLAHVRTVDENAVYGPRAQFLAARLQRQAGDAQGAIDSLDRFIGRYPYAFYRDDVDMELAEAYIAVERYDDAAAGLYRLEGQNPGRSGEGGAKARRAAGVDRRPGDG